ncbi:MAG: hypothetical protein IPM29_21400 [Planctomycetes bacterium]|nr:hypothetical protein [Planctomycetota bacterium]
MPRPFAKALTVLGEDPNRPVLRYYDDWNSCPALKIAVFDYFEIRPRQGGALINVGASNGTVVFSRCYFPPLNTYPLHHYDAHRVIYIDCDIDSVSPAVSIYRSEVLLLGCRTSARFSRDGSLGEGGVYVKEGGRVTIVGGSVTGGDGYQDCIGYIRLPGPAVTAFSDRAFIYGPVVLAGGVLRGPCGNGYREIEFWSNCGPENVGAIDPLAIPNRSWSCPHYISREMPAIVAGPAARGQHQTLQVWGPSHSNVTVFASLLHPYDPIALSIGDVWLNPYLILEVGSGAVNAARELTLTTTIPSWLPRGEVLVYQAVSLSPQGAFELSAPGMAVVH